MSVLKTNKSSGFSLLELVTVLLIITVLSTIAIRSTVDIGYATRYEQTRDMADKIKKAIAGHPGRLVNGQPDVSGYVADIGRTPDYLRDLLQAGYCESSTGAYLSAFKNNTDCENDNVANEWVWSTTPCLDQTTTPAGNNTGISNKADCDTAAFTWLGVEVNPTTNLKYGWNGPYIQTADQADNPGALHDGWGNEPDVLIPSTVNNYGWFLIPAMNVGDSFSIESFGKDQANGPNNNCYDASASDGYSEDCITTITQVEYTKTIGSLSVKINTDDTRVYTDSGFCDAEGYCSDPTFTTQATCVGGNVWHPNCTNPAYLTKSTCEGASPPEMWNQSLTNNAQCLFYGGTWSAGIDAGSQVNICMQIYYRVNGELVVTPFISSSPSLINRDGSQQNVTFSFASTEVPNGINAIGIYEANNNGTPLDLTDDICTGTLGGIYPMGHSIQHVTFAPYKSIDNLVW